MKRFISVAGPCALAFALAGAAVAQDTSTESHSMDPADAMSEMALPGACQAGAPPLDMGEMAEMQAAMEGMDEDQRAFMQGMMATQGPMMRGMMAEDTDIAFACAMIPHHQGAISMAEVELQYGDDEKLKQVAQKIIEDQRREIEELKQLIAEEAQ